MHGEKLLNPCAKCGGKPILHTRDIKCLADCTIHCSKCDMFVHCQTQEGAIAEWNKCNNTRGAMKSITVKPMRYPESGGIEYCGYIPKGTVCGTAVVEGCETILHDGKVVCDVDSGMAGEYFERME